MQNNQSANANFKCYSQHQSLMSKTSKYNSSINKSNQSQSQNNNESFSLIDLNEQHHCKKDQSIPTEQQGELPKIINNNANKQLTQKVVNQKLPCSKVQVGNYHKFHSKMIKMQQYLSQKIMRQSNEFDYEVQNKYIKLQNVQSKQLDINVTRLAHNKLFSYDNNQNLFSSAQQQSTTEKQVMQKKPNDKFVFLNTQCQNMYPTDLFSKSDFFAKTKRVLDTNEFLRSHHGKAKQHLGQARIPMLQLQRSTSSFSSFDRNSGHLIQNQKQDNFYFNTTHSNSNFDSSSNFCQQNVKNQLEITEKLAKKFKSLEGRTFGGTLNEKTIQKYQLFCRINQNILQKLTNQSLLLSNNNNTNNNNANSNNDMQDKCTIQKPMTEEEILLSQISSMQETLCSIFKQLDHITRTQQNAQSLHCQQTAVLNQKITEQDDQIYRLQSTLKRNQHKFNDKWEQNEKGKYESASCQLNLDNVKMAALLNQQEKLICVNVNTNDTRDENNFQVQESLPELQKKYKELKHNYLSSQLLSEDLESRNQQYLKQFDENKFLISNYKNAISLLEGQVQELQSKFNQAQQMLQQTTTELHIYQSKYESAKETSLLQLEESIAYSCLYHEQVQLVKKLYERNKEAAKKLNEYENLQAEVLDLKVMQEMPRDQEFLKKINNLYLTKTLDHSQYKCLIKITGMPFQGINKEQIQKNVTQGLSIGCQSAMELYLVGLNNDKQQKSPLYVKQQPSEIDQQNQSKNQSNPTTGQQPQDINPDFLKQFKFPRITFFQLLKDFYVENQDCVQRMFLAQEQLKTLDFLQTIRGILDCKYNEQCMVMTSSQNASVKQLSRFPEFVYHWLGKFSVDPNNAGGIILLEKNSKCNNFDDADQLRTQFYLTLQNEKYAKLWEVVTFAEFLDEHCSQDELYFFLFCRNLLYQGAQLKNKKAVFETVHYIEVEHAKQIVRRVLHSLDEKALYFVMKKINSKAKPKHEKCILVDSQFVLRILLQYYKLERVQRFNLICDLFYSQPQIQIRRNDQSITFEGFQKIFANNFQHVSSEEMLTIYRDCWNIGDGCVTPQIFFTLATENNFFIKLLQLNYNLPLPHRFGNAQELELEEDKKDNSQQQQDKLACQTILQQFNKNEPLLQCLINQATSLGVSQLCSELNLELNFWKRNLSINAWDFHFPEMHEYVTRIQTMAQSVRNGMVNQFTPTQQKSIARQLLLFDLNALESNLYLIKKLTTLQEAQIKKENLCIGRLQRAFQKKILEWYKKLLITLQLADSQAQAQQERKDKQRKTYKLRGKQNQNNVTVTGDINTVNYVNNTKQNLDIQQQYNHDSSVNNERASQQSSQANSQRLQNVE